MVDGFEDPCAPFERVRNLEDSLSWILTFIEEHPEWWGGSADECPPEQAAEYEWYHNARRLLDS